MKKSVYIVLIFVLLAGVLASCAAKPGDALITVKGKIDKTNSGSNYVLDQAAFDSKSVELTYNDPWMGDGLKYKGILLKDLIEMVKPAADVTTVSLICTDGKAYDVALADAQKYDIMLTHWVGGELLTEENGGPVKVAYPDDAKATYPDENWAWWIVSVEFK
ncbi:MAG: molybdopterin-dependent oxidoreductase [Anaerolineaceae bacterium]